MEEKPKRSVLVPAGWILLCLGIGTPGFLTGFVNGFNLSSLYIKLPVPGYGLRALGFSLLFYPGLVMVIAGYRRNTARRNRFELPPPIPTASPSQRSEGDGSSS